MRFPEHVYQDYWPGDDEVLLFKSKIIKTRKQHLCIHYQGKHFIAPGTTALLQTGKLDGIVASCYTCTDCMDKYFLEVRPNDAIS